MPESDLQETLSSIKHKAPFLDISRLEELIRKNPHGNASDYIVDRMFNNGLRNIPKEFPALQRKYVNLASHYFKEYDIKNSHDPALILLSYLAEVCGYLFSSDRLQRALGNSSVYHKTAKEIITFYKNNKEDIKLLSEVGMRLQWTYHTLWTSHMNIERESQEMPILSEIIEEKGSNVLKDPSIVSTIWYKVKKACKK